MTVSTWTFGEDRSLCISAITDSLSLLARDHDEQTNVIEAVKKLNEVKGVRGIRRFFKQIAQSAKGADQDDFLGCITIPVQEIPSSGLDGWYKLSGRSSKSQVYSLTHSIYNCNLSEGSRIYQTEIVALVKRRQVRRENVSYKREGLTKIKFPKCGGQSSPNR